MQVTLDIVPYIYKALATLVVGGLGYAFMFPFRKAKAEFVSLKETTAKIHEELTHQRQNCLATLQNQGDKQIELLGKMSDTLSGVRLDFAEHRSYVQGLVQSPRRTKAYAKK